MWKNAIVATVTVLMGLCVLLFGQLDFLIPYKTILFRRFGEAMLWYGGLLGVNLYAGFFLLTRKLLLKDTGRKLHHLEKQLRDGGLPHELAERINSEG